MPVLEQTQTLIQCDGCGLICADPAQRNNPAVWHEKAAYRTIPGHTFTWRPVDDPTQHMCPRCTPKA